MKLVRRCLSCNSPWVDWNIKLQTIEKVYAHDCYRCGEIELSSGRKYGGVPRFLLFLSRRIRAFRT